MAKSINVRLALKDQFTSPLTKATKNIKSMDRQLKKTKNQIKAFGRSVKKTMKSAAKYTAIGLTAMTIAVTAFGKSSVNAAKVQIEQETKLAAVLKNVKGVRDSDIVSIKKYASALQEQGVVGDEVTLSGVQQLGTFQLQAKTLKTLMPSMTDLLAQQKGLNATTGDAVNIGNLLGKAMTGQIGALSRVGVTFDKTQAKVLKYGSEQEKAAVLVKVLKKNVGGANKALAQTDMGKIKNTTMAWGDMKEEVGKGILPILAKFFKWFKTKIPTIQDTILGVIDTISNVVTQVKPYIEQARLLFGKIFDDVKPAVSVFKDLMIDIGNKVFNTVTFITKNFDRISPAIYTVVGAMIAYKTVMFIGAAYTTAMTIATKIKASWDAFGAAKLTVLTAAQWAYNAALNANPIGLVITGVAALVGIVWVAIKNFDLIKARVLSLWNAFTGIGVVKTAFNTIWSVVSTVFGKLKNAFNNFINFLGKAVDKILHPIKSIKDGISGGLKKAANFLGIGEDKEGTVSQMQKPKYPRHSLGTAYFKGGVTGINEGGRNETAVLPSGTKILSHNESKNLITNKNGKIEMNIHIHGNFIGEKEHLDKYADYTCSKILANLDNM